MPFFYSRERHLSPQKEEFSYWWGHQRNSGNVKQAVVSILRSLERRPFRQSSGTPNLNKDFCNQTNRPCPQKALSNC